MRVFIIRHAIATERSPDVPDDSRPLTRRGRKRFRSTAKGLARLFPSPDHLLTSPLVRAKETARMAGEAWQVRPTAEPALAGGSIAEVEAVLRRYDTGATIALVGHEPQVSELLAHLVGSTHADRLTFKKGGVAVVDLPAGPSGVGVLLAVLPPRVLRAV
jgi:phosphohistidine phosphatase